MKIGFSQHYDGPGGARSWIKSFSSYCISRGHQVTFGFNPGVDVFCSVASMSTVKELQALKNTNIKILQRIGAIYLPYNHPNPALIKARNDNFKSLISYANKNVYQSIFSKTVLLRSIYNGCEPDGDIIYNSVNESIFTPQGAKINHSSSKRIILSIAYWGTPHTASKSIETFIHIAKALQYREDIEFWVLGKAFPNNEEILRQANLPNVTKIDLSNPIAREEMPIYLRTPDLLLSFKAHEACSNLVVEAMHTGTPIVGLESGSLPELVQDAALLTHCTQELDQYPIVDIKHMCENILKTLSNREYYRQKMLDRAKYFREENTHQRYMQLIEQLYNS